MRKGIQSALLLAIAAASVVACSKPDVSGTYVLVSGDNEGLPVRLAFENKCLTALMSGSVVLNKDGKYKSSMILNRACIGKTDVLPDAGNAGTWQLHKENIDFIGPSNYPMGTGVLRHDTLRVKGPQHSLVYVRKTH